jgi:hypothetical protein
MKPFIMVRREKDLEGRNSGMLIQAKGQ